MNLEQATNLAHELAMKLAEDFGDEYFVHKQEDGDPTPPAFWVLDRDSVESDNLDCLDLDPDHYTCFTPTPITVGNKPKGWVVQQNFTDGGGCIWLDKEQMIETLF